MIDEERELRMDFFPIVFRTEKEALDAISTPEVGEGEWQVIKICHLYILAKMPRIRLNGFVRTKLIW